MGPVVCGLHPSSDREGDWRPSIAAALAASAVATATVSTAPPSCPATVAASSSTATFAPLVATVALAVLPSPCERLDRRRDPQA